MSQLFEVRESAENEDNQADIQTHIDLCRKVLATYLQSIRTLSLSPKTWEFLIRILLGLGDFLLGFPHAKPGYKPDKVWNSSNQDNLLIYMVDNLDQDIIVVLLEGWIRSEITDVELWIHFRKYFSQWLHRLSVIKYWTALKIGLTSTLLISLYSENLDPLVIYQYFIIYSKYYNY